MGQLFRIQRPRARLACAVARLLPHVPAAFVVVVLDRRVYTAPSQKEGYAAIQI